MSQTTTAKGRTMQTSREIKVGYRVHLVALAILAAMAFSFVQPCIAARDSGRDRKTSKATSAHGKDQSEREKRRARRQKEAEREKALRPKNGKVFRDKCNPLELDVSNGKKNTTAQTFGPFRTEPRFRGEFSVGLVVIEFPDCETPPDMDTIVNRLSSVGEYTLKDYYVEYSQGITWPKLFAYDAVYKAPYPLGYYCRHDSRSNKLGFEDPSDGGRRAGELKSAALEFAKSRSSNGRRQFDVTAWVYCRRLDPDRVRAIPDIRDEYPKPKEDWQDDPIDDYKPRIPWADPLWPNSSVQVHYPGGGGVLVHELGHVLGSPDFYHASEEHDGMPGGPDKHSYGPTGPGYCRYIYHAFAPKESFPTLTTNGTYCLDPRSAPIPREGGVAPPVLGCFIASAHPHYVFQLEYVHNDKRPVGDVDDGGLMVNVINVDASLKGKLGPPDLCYTYRRGDKYMKGEIDSDVFLREGDTFDLKSDPWAVVPPLIIGGIEISGIKFREGKCFFDLRFTGPRRDAKFLEKRLLPCVAIREAEELLPTSVRARCEVLYRGEPLLTEYGFTWDTRPDPEIKKNKYPLFHRDRYDARILGLSPGTKYYIRAYAKNDNGVTYSKKTVEITTPKTASEVPPLLTDKLQGNFFITRHYFVIHPEDLYRDSANALIMLMSLGCYYGVVPGKTPKGEDPIYMRDVHTNPSDSRPKFRMKSFGRCLSHVRGLAREAGLMDKKFGKPLAWRKKCAQALGIKDPDKAFVQANTAGALEAQRPRIKEWLDKSQPVLLIRENRLMPDVTSHIYPLDTAVIDGYNKKGEWHVYFPLGCDRGIGERQSGYYSADDLLVSAEDACLLFWAPSSPAGVVKRR